jgi:hypothetical protein
MAFEPSSKTMPPTTMPSPLHALASDTRPATPDAATTPARWRTRRLMAAQAAIALAFDAAILVVMLALAWELLMPWSRALEAANGLMAIGLVVCGGLWAAFVEQDLRRWRRLRRTRRRARG